MTYREFLAGKQITDKPTGLDIVPKLNPQLFDFQRDITTWALRRGRASLFEDCGLGKTPQQLEWADKVAGKMGRRFIGIELKESYYKQMDLNLAAARQESLQLL